MKAEKLRATAALKVTFDKGDEAVMITAAMAFPGFDLCDGYMSAYSANKQPDSGDLRHARPGSLAY